MYTQVSLDIKYPPPGLLAQTQKSELKPTAPKVRNRKARGKRVAEAERVAPGQVASNWGALKVRNILPLSPVITLFQSCRTKPEVKTRGDALRFRYALAPGFPIPRLWRCSARQSDF